MSRDQLTLRNPSTWWTDPRLSARLMQGINSPAGLLPRNGDCYGPVTEMILNAGCAVESLPSRCSTTA